MLACSALEPFSTSSALIYSLQGGVTDIARDIRVNEKIRAREVRVIGDDGQQLGVYSLYAALNLARERGLDLVEVAPNAVPPVCRLMDYGRYKYEQQKRDQEAHRAQRTNDLKEVRMAPVIDEHDIETKTNMIRRFVEDGDKVKVTIQFRGAQMRHQEIGRDVLERILTSLRGVAVLERPIIMEGRNMSMFIGAPGSRQAGAGQAREGSLRPGLPTTPESVAAAAARPPTASGSRVATPSGAPPRMAEPRNASTASNRAPGAGAARASGSAGEPMPASIARPQSAEEGRRAP